VFVNGWLDASIIPQIPAPWFMTLALLIALAGSLVLMALIVKKLEKAS
jgi:hypothetical protein